MNWWIFLAGLLYIGGALQYFLYGYYLLGITFVAYAIANFALCKLT